MSVWEKYTKGWTFRTSRPTFEVGEELDVFVTGFEGETAIVRVGDTILRVPDAPRDALDKRVRLRVESFDDNDHDGTATLLDVVGEGTY
jgi:hypothetical protein